MRSQPPIDWDEEWAKVQQEEAEALRAERGGEDPVPWFMYVVFVAYIIFGIWALLFLATHMITGL